MNKMTSSSNGQVTKLCFDEEKISKEAAFFKGVEYFSELVFFYALLFGVAYYELSKTS